jgi:hypothetical protein
MLVEGKLERFAAAGGAINVLVSKVGSIAAPDRLIADIKDFSMLDEQVRLAREGERSAFVGARGGPWTRGSSDSAQSEESADAEDFRAVAPPVMSFASGRRR